MSAAYHKIVIWAVAFAALLAVLDYAPVFLSCELGEMRKLELEKTFLKVVVSVFGANKEIGEILSLVTVNEKFLKAKLFNLHSMEPTKPALPKMRMSLSSLRHFQKKLL